MPPRWYPTRATFLALASLISAACTSGLIAPNNYEVPDTTTTAGSTTQGGPIALDCSSLEDSPGALQAAFAYVPTLTGGEGSFTWSATNLPPGIQLDTQTGQLGGIPTMTGVFAFDLSVIDGSGSMASASCELEVRPALALTLVAESPYCLSGSESLLDLLVAGTGDDSPIVCEHTGGSGNGRLPAGISVDPDTCSLQGTAAGLRYGVHVFIVRATQSGASIYAPYCVFQDQAPGQYDITTSHTDLDGQVVDGTGSPFTRTFPPDMNFSVGAAMDPYVEVTDSSVCDGPSCSYVFSYEINASPFDPDSLSLGTTSLVNDSGTNNPIGFSHELSILANRVAPEFRDRPWVVNIGFDYCLARMPAACQGDSFDTNKNGDLELDILMLPE